jgi:hypothetical protein
MPVTRTPNEEYHGTNDSSTKNIMDVKISKVIAKVLLPQLNYIVPRKKTKSIKNVRLNTKGEVVDIEYSEGSEDAR